jgi:hypothetical protein
VTITEPLSRVECRDILSPHLTTLEQCFAVAWTRWTAWLAALDGSPTDVSARTRANALHDFIAKEAEVRFMGAKGVQVKRKRGLLVITIADRVAIRFKKFRGKTLRFARNATRQTAAFDSQQLVLTDDALQPMTLLVAGYLLDGLESGIDTIAVTCSVDGDHFWAPIQVTGADTVQTAPARQLPTTDPTAAKPGVRSKRAKPAAENSEGG